MKSLLIGLIIASLSLTINCDCPHQEAGLTKWSTWNGRATGDYVNVTINANEKILLDVSPGFKVGKIDIYGELIFDNTELTVDAYYILVENGGHLWIGSEDCPLDQKITITLWGLTLTDKTQIPLAKANKVLGAFAGGIIDIHGTPRLPTWTVLDATANPGDTSITLAESVTWAVGDEIIIATTDYTHRDDTSTDTANDPNNGGNDFMEERRTITSVNIQGSTSIISFEEPLKYMHYGEIWQANDGTGNSIDMRGEVGLLTRNIVIRGDITEGTTAKDHWGGHIMAEAICSIRIRGVELYHMGQKNNLARYPIHVHLCGDSPTSYAKENAIHDTFQRCITIHGTNFFTVQDNVAFNSSGHCYFIEDGDETGNILHHNLGIRANPHTLLIPADATPAVFWVTNANNGWTNNVAVGGHFGFWFSLPSHPLAFGAQLPDASTLMWNRKTPLSSFEGNKAHSATRKGLHFDDGLVTPQGKTEMYSYFPTSWQNYVDTNTALQLAAMPASWGGENLLEQLMYYLTPNYTIVKDFTAYKCIEHGIWGRGNRIHVIGAKLADNQIGAQFPGDGHIFEDSFIVGETDNIGNPVLKEYEQGRSRFYRWGTDYPIIGYQGYDNGGPDIVRNVRIYNFNDFYFMFNGKVRKAGGISVQGGHGVLTPRHRFYNVGFINTPNHVYFRPSSPSGIYGGYEPNYISAVVIDVDGSITGKCGSEVVYPSPMLITPECVSYPNWNAYVCPPGNKPHRWFAVTDQKGTPIYGSTSDVINLSTTIIYRLTDHATFYLMSQLQDIYEENDVSIIYRKDSYTNILSNTPYLLQFGSNFNPPSSVSIQFAHASKGEWIRIAIPYPTGTTFTFSKYSGNDWTMASSLSELSFLKYFYDTSTNLLWIHIEMVQENYRYDKGYWLLDRNMNIQFNANCSSNNYNCSQVVDPLKITAPDGKAPTVSTICESGGNYLGGDLTVTLDESVKPWVLFDETWDVEWQIASWTKNWVISSEVSTSQSSSLKVTFSQNSIYFYRVNKQKSYPADSYTHFAFNIRSENGRGRVNIGVGFNDMDGDDLNDAYYGGSINNPIFTSSGPVDDSSWHSIYIPLSYLGIGPGLYNELYAFRIWPENWELLNTTIYIDEIRLAKYSTSFVPQQSVSTSNINYQYDYSSDNPPPPTMPTPTTVNSNINSPSTSSSSTDDWAIPVVVILAVIVVAVTIALIVTIIRNRKSYI